ncbi:response regulator [Eubacterium aggregans]|uniref:response regulator n=1 Tax=Eubacterium aggregans TaxID=81409 RepID=UPI003F3F4867
MDDTATNQMVAKELLEPYHLSIDLASSWAEGIEQLMVKPFDLVFLDYCMPEMDGVKTLRDIR